MKYGRHNPIPPAVRRREEQAIVRFVRRNPGCSAADLDRALGVGRSNARTSAHVRRLLDGGELRHGPARPESRRCGARGLYAR